MARHKRKVRSPPPPNVPAPAWAEPPRPRVPLRERAGFALFVHVVAVLCGLFIFAFVAFISYLCWRAEGASFRSIGGAITAPLAGFESWRQTVRLNLGPR